jgi:O-antigen ligase
VYRHPYLEPSRVQADLCRAAAGDPWGHRVHVALAVLWCFFLGWPTSFVEVAAAPLIVFFFLRTPHIWRTWGSWVVQPLTLALGAWIAWQALSLSWSPDPRHGLKELAGNRWVWAGWVLWPVLSRRPWLIWAMAAGFLAGNVSQALHTAGRVAGWEWLTFNRLADRNSGWWDPVVGGSLLVGALGLHLPAAIGLLRQRPGRESAVAAALTVVTLAGVFATGTRGAWIAAALLLGLVGSWGLAAHLRGGEHHPGAGRRPTGKLPGWAALAAIVVICGAGAALLWPTVRGRYEAGRAEVERALRQGDYSSDTGRRLLMWRAAAEAIATHPVRGTGAGGYQRWAVEHVRQRGVADPERAIHAHAHSAPLHIAATTGLVGLALAGGVMIVALRGAFRGAGGPGGYRAGPGFAIAGLMLAGLFDPVHLNAQTGAFLFTLLALCPWPRPREERSRDRANEEPWDDRVAGIPGT